MGDAHSRFGKSLKGLLRLLGDTAGQGDTLSFLPARCSGLSCNQAVNCQLDGPKIDPTHAFLVVRPMHLMSLHGEFQ